MKYILFFFTFLFITNLQAQFTNKYWNLGRKCAMDFNTVPPTINLADSNKNCTLKNSNSLICDRNGNTIFYSNGLRVFNRNGHVMPNGSGIDSGHYSTTYATSGSYNPLMKGVVSIPFPNDTNKFYLFYLNMEWSVDGGYSPEKLYYLVVDRTLNGGLGDVTVKEQVVISGDTLNSDDLFAIKHGNGKDWWVIVRKYKSDKYYKVLVDNAGVHINDIQKIGNGFNYSGSFSGAGNISLQGDKLCYLYNNLNYQPFQMDLLDFDRCTGTLSNYKTIFHPNTTDTIMWWAACFSANGRYLYFNDRAKVFQMDLQATNLLNSVVDVGHDTVNYRQFFKMELAPDNKIYISPYGSDKHMSVIHAPDSAGMACRFVQNAVSLGLPSSGVWIDGGLPNVPNFALGAINCNVGIKGVAEENNGLQIHPNPTNQSLVISQLSSGNIKIEVCDVLGRKFENLKMSKFENEIQIQVNDLANGIYILKLTDEKGFQQVVKFVKE